MSIDTEEFRKNLLEERARVERAIANLRRDDAGLGVDEVDDDSGDESHLGDAAAVTLDREIDYTLEENSGQVLAEIDAALRRIEEGTYGICTVCGKEIAPERLEAYPWASLCIDDARLAEHR